MALLEEVTEGADESAGDAESLKAAHRRRRSKGANAKGKKKKKTEGESASVQAVFAILFGAAVVIAVGLWSRSAAMDRKANSCKMTMSRPDYVHLPVPGYPRVGEETPEQKDEIPGYQYRLVRYIDGKLPAYDKRNPSKPRGIPVLFVPGHLGNFKQVRSLGSHAAEAKVSGSRRRLDIFALDLLEEMTALHGSMVWRQAEFLNHAVEVILGLYEGEAGARPVSSVMIVGHSLGGMVARTAFTLPSYRIASITDIVTLGTPHERPPWLMDYAVLHLYSCTDALWRWHSSSPATSTFSPCWSGYGTAAETAPPVSTTFEGVTDETADSDPAEAFLLGGAEAESVASSAGDASDTCSGDCPVPPIDPVVEESAASTSETAGGDVVPVLGWGRVVGVDAESVLGNTVLVSVSAGPNDLMVHPSLCPADGLGLDGQSVVLNTSDVEGCGFGMDHLALVWCKQLVSRVVATLSELEKLHAAGVGAKERTRTVAGILESPRRSSGAVRSGSATRNGQSLETEGPEEAATTMDEVLAVARSLVTDRTCLLIPAWVCVACLVLAAALIRGLSAKNSKEGALPPMPLLLTPRTHLHVDAVDRALRSLWASLRAQGALATVTLATSCCLVALWVGGDGISVVLPAAVHLAFEKVVSLPGVSIVWMAGAKFLRLVAEVVAGGARTLNPFEGAGDALRLQPVKGVIAVYAVSLGWMLTFVYLVAVLGTVGNGISRVGRRSPVRLAGCLRSLQNRKAATVVACAAIAAAHLKSFSLPVTFREVTLKGELSMAFMALSLSLYVLLVSLAIFPASSTAASAHQRLILLLYAPVPAVLMGPQLAAAGILAQRGGAHESFVASGELAQASLALLPIIASVWFARRARPFPSPPGISGFLAELKAQVDEEVARSSGGGNGSAVGLNGRGGAINGHQGSTAALAAAALAQPNGHGACGQCLHADGGRGAVFVETDQERVQVGAGVALGPGFRVVACDCPRRDRAAPSGWCEFCRCVCKVCGGCKEATRALKASRGSKGREAEGGGGAGFSEEVGAVAAVGVVSVAVLYAGLWAFGMRVMAAPCHSLWALSAMGAVLCALHWGASRDAARGFGRS